MVFLIRVVVDYRERGSGVFEDLKRYDVRIETRALDIGDYLVSDRVVIERKSMEDFCSSIKDGRVFKQAQKMSEYEKPVILVTDGDMTIRPASFLGAISSLMLDYGMSVVMVDEIFAAQFIYRLAYREQTKERRHPAVRHSKPKGIREMQIYLLSGLPGINSSLGGRILDEFGTPLAFFNSGEKSKVRGLGEKKIKRIEEILTRDLRGDSHGHRKKD